MTRDTSRSAGTLILLTVGCLSLQPACEDSSKSKSTATDSTAATTGSGSGGGSSTTTNGAAGADGDDGGDLVVGTFEVEMVPAEEETADAPAREAFTSVLGRVYEYPVPNQVDWEIEDEQAGCQLLVPRIPFCDPACSGGAVCGDDDECVSFPEPYDLGPVTFSGIATETGDSFTVDPLPPSNTYQPLASAGLVYPPFTAGDTVSLQTGGGDLETFGITATGIDELELTEPAEALLLAPDMPAEFAWEVPKAEGSHVEVVIDISHHGGQKGEIRCSVEDNGSLTIPAELVTGLINLGFSGFPGVLVSRVAVGAAQTSAGRIELKLVNAVDRAIEIPGLVSCEEAGSSEGCPDGETCQDDLKCG